VKKLTERQKTALPQIGIAVLFLLLIGLTALLLTSLSRASDSDSSLFDLGMISSDTAKTVEVSTLLTPEFAGITSNGVRVGASYPSLVMRDIFRMFAPTLSVALQTENRTPATDGEWENCIREKDSVYFRFHDELPEAVVGFFADSVGEGTGERSENGSYLYELFLLPYDAQASETVLYTRSLSGDVCRYSVTYPEHFSTAGDFATVTRSYSSSLCGFSFADGNYTVLNASEPIFTEQLTAKNIIISNLTASMLENTSDGTERLLELFGMNPDKVSENSGEESAFVDSRGVLYIRESSFEYRAATGGSIRLSELAPEAEDGVIGRYLTAAMRIAETVRSFDRNLLGGEAEYTLSSFSSVEGTVKISFRYTFDNIPLAGVAPAIQVTFVDGILTEADIYTLSVRSRADTSRSMTEWGFANYLETGGIRAVSTTLVYRSDFSSESVNAEWMAEAAE